jgi:hypothetical protein
MALSNAEKQKRWRGKRNELAADWTGKPSEIAENILRNLGADQARKVSRALDKRLRNLRPDCPECKGTGWRQFEISPKHMYPYDGKAGAVTLPCDCGNPKPPTKWELAVERHSKQTAADQQELDRAYKAGAITEEEFHSRYWPAKLQRPVVT